MPTLSLLANLLESTTKTRTTRDSVAIGVGDLEQIQSIGQVYVTGAVEAVFPLAGIETVQALWMTSDQDVTVFFGAATVGFSLKGGGILVLMNTSITSIKISNSSGNKADVRAILGGIAAESGD